VWEPPPPSLLHTIAMTDVISRQTSHCDTHSQSSSARRSLTVDLILYWPNPFEESSQLTFSFYVESKDGARIFYAQEEGGDFIISCFNISCKYVSQNTAWNMRCTPDAVLAGRA
jgi:hypothetical protein